MLKTSRRCQRNREPGRLAAPCKKAAPQTPQPHYSTPGRTETERPLSRKLGEEVPEVGGQKCARADGYETPGEVRDGGGEDEAQQQLAAALDVVPAGRVRCPPPAHEDVREDHARYARDAPP